MWCLVSILLGILLAFAVLWAYRAQRKEAAYRDELLQIKASQGRLQEYLEEQILHGHTPKFEFLPDLYRIYGLSFSSDLFMVLAAKLRDSPGDSQSRTDAYARAQMALARELPQGVEPHFQILDGLLACFFSEPGLSQGVPESTVEALRQQLAERCASAAEALKRDENLDLLISVGTYDLGGFGIHSNFLTAKALLEQALSTKFSGRVVLDASQLSRRPGTDFANLQRQFYNCFVSFQFDAAAEYLLAMMQLRMLDFHDPFAEAKEVVATQLRFCMNMLSLPLNESFPLESGGTIAIRDLMYSPDPETLALRTKRYFSALASALVENGVQPAPIAERICGYIQVHYADTDLTVTSLSETFHINISYLSRMFKQEYGNGVLEYIHKARIAAARTLLERGLSPNEIFAQVGYASRRALDSAFTRYEGISPKAYQSKCICPVMATI